jgi:hypothetical protein
VYGFVLGDSTRNIISGLYVDCNNNSGAVALAFSNGCNGNNVELTAENVAVSREIVQYGGTLEAKNNNVTILYAGGINAGAWIVSYLNANANANTCNLQSTDSAPRTYVSDYITSNGFTTNRFQLTGSPTTEYATIASNVVSIKNGATTYLSIDTEGLAATDDLTSITGDLVNGREIIVSTTSNVRDVIVRNGTGNILLSGAADRSLLHASRTLILQYRTGLSAWVEIGYAAPV